jgi:hypothetical protein
VNAEAVTDFGKIFCLNAPFLVGFEHFGRPKVSEPVMEHDFHDCLGVLCFEQGDYFVAYRLVDHQDKHLIEDEEQIDHKNVPEVA